MQYIIIYVYYFDVNLKLQNLNSQSWNRFLWGSSLEETWGSYWPRRWEQLRRYYSSDRATFLAPTLTTGPSSAYTSGVKRLTVVGLCRSLMLGIGTSIHQVSPFQRYFPIDSANCTRTTCTLLSERWNIFKITK